MFLKGRHMLLSASNVCRRAKFGPSLNPNGLQPHCRPGLRSATTTGSGAYLAEPEPSTFGLVKVILTVSTGLYIGAAISKTCATFLEENDIFVPSDDDDDD